VFTVFRLLTDFVCLYTYEFSLSLCKIVRSSVILLLPLWYRNKAVTWKTAGVCCDSCDTWYHKDCIGMNTMIYKGLHNVSWNCDLCDLPNLSSCLFDTSTFVVTNIYETLNNSSFNEKSIGSPTAASSPLNKQKPSRNYTANNRNDTHLRVLVINC
jgi:hypothetical protein